MNQQPNSSSPLFALPRELRDKIYGFYTFRENGYTYNPDTRQFRSTELRDNHHQFALNYTCRAIAEELRGVALELNTLTFKPHLCEDNLDDVEDIRSDAEYISSITKAWHTLKVELLFYAAPYFKERDLEKLAEMHPHHFHLEKIHQFRLELLVGKEEALRTHTQLKSTIVWSHSRVTQYDLTSNQAFIHDALSLVSKRSDFSMIATKIWRRELEPSLYANLDPILRKPSFC